MRIPSTPRTAHTCHRARRETMSPRAQGWWEVSCSNAASTAIVAHQQALERHPHPSALHFRGGKAAERVTPAPRTVHGQRVGGRSARWTRLGCPPHHGSRSDTTQEDLECRENQPRRALANCRTKQEHLIGCEKACGTCLSRR
ncbi:hypothetical protein TRVL_07452 [Trypanosoma vivax]|nr:hypothetical protein TRVL_07452 [Trypanosoma vivax]